MLMYGIEGRSWVAMGGPVGAEDKHEELVWRFRDIAEQHGGWPVFYQVGEEHLGLCVEMGLSLIKLGEVGAVPLAGFSLQGGERKEMRQILRKLEKEGLSFGWIEVEDVPAHMDELRVISDAWLEDKNTREKGFSLGFFEPSYLARYPVAVVRSGERIIAFVNVWGSAGKAELSVDLMRSLPEAPRGVMDFLFIHLMSWGAEHGYQSFSMGMAPLAGIEERPGVSMWNRIGALIYRHGEYFYNFQGLRQYKDKFDPTWEPRFLASPGGLALPQILTNVATLIAGGLRGVFAR
jgi:phosphatidylglycerol lysyltransferase